MDSLLNVDGLETHFDTRDGVVHAVNGVSFTLREGETLGFVGESGSGKSVTMMSVLRLIQTPPGRVVAGSVIYKDRDLLKISDEDIRKIRGNDISFIFQDPMTSFNPVLTIGQQLIEPLMIHQKISTQEAENYAISILEKVGIPAADERLGAYPHQFSGGMRQRVMIAMALICTPKILIADEPTTALDVTIQAQIVDLVKTLRDELGTAIIWVTHDLGLLAGLADRINVMYAGLIVESVLVEELYSNPQHPYTINLLGSLPRVDANEHRRLTVIEGMPPVMMEKPNYCPFAPRCNYAIDICWNENPSLLEINNDHFAACWVNTNTGRKR